MSSKRKLRDVLEKDGAVAVESPSLEDFKSRIRQGAVSWFCLRAEGLAK